MSTRLADGDGYMNIYNTHISTRLADGGGYMHIYIYITLVPFLLDVYKAKYLTNGT